MSEILLKNVKGTKDLRTKFGQKDFQARYDV